MLNFFKGIIFLSQQKFYEASIAFLINFKVNVNNNVYNSFQLESFKRLSLLANIIDPIYRANITNVINQNKTLLYIKPSEIYHDFSKIFNNKSNGFKDVEKFVKENMNKFKIDKTYGLAKLSLKEFGLNKISNLLKSYKKIKIDKLANHPQLEMDRTTLLNYLKIFSLKNKINVKVDEVDDIIEVFDDDFDEKMSIDELKISYNNINSIQEDLIQMNFKKVENYEATKFEMEEAMLGGGNPGFQVRGLQGMDGSGMQG